MWEDVDNMPKEDFDMKTFFNLHDLTGDGYLDEAELEALFQKELDKVYDKDAKEDDMRERYFYLLDFYQWYAILAYFHREEEEARMRKHVQEEMDSNKDGLISLEEFLGSLLSSSICDIFSLKQCYWLKGNKKIRISVMIQHGTQ